MNKIFQLFLLLTFCFFVQEATYAEQFEILTTVELKENQTLREDLYTDTWSKNYFLVVNNTGKYDLNYKLYQKLWSDKNTIVSGKVSPGKYQKIPLRFRSTIGPVGIYIQLNSGAYEKRKQTCFCIPYTIKNPVPGSTGKAYLCYRF